MKTYATDTLLEQKQMEEEMKRGVAASESGDKAAAERIFRSMVERNPDALEAWVWLGWTSADVDDAEAAFKQASMLDPSNEESQLGLRWVASQREAAFGAPTQAGIATAPTLAQAPSQTASNLNTQPRMEEVGEDWDAAEMLEKGRIAAQAGNKQDAFAIFKQMAERQPDSADVWVWLGGTCSDLDEAEEAFRHALLLDPTHEGANLGLRWSTLRRRALENPEPAPPVAPTVAASTSSASKSIARADSSVKKAPPFKRWGELSLSARLLMVAVAVVWIVLVVLLVTMW